MAACSNECTNALAQLHVAVASVQPCTKCGYIHTASSSNAAARKGGVRLFSCGGTIGFAGEALIGAALARHLDGISSSSLSCLVYELARDGLSKVGFGGEGEACEGSGREGTFDSAMDVSRCGTGTCW